MDLCSLNHVSLLVRDVERSRQFYRQILGMEEMPRPATFDFPGAWLSKGSIIIHLIGEVEPGRVDQLYSGTYRPDELARGYGTHIAFEVVELEAALQHLRAHNIEIVGGPRSRGDGVIQFYICDPDRYVLEFFAWQK